MHKSLSSENALVINKEKKKKINLNRSSDNMYSQDLNDNNNHHHNLIYSNSQSNINEEGNNNNGSHMLNNNISNIHSNSDSNSIENTFNNFTSNGEIYSLTYINNIAIIGDGSDMTYFYNTQSKLLLNSFKYNTESVNFLKISKDNKYLISTSLDGLITIFHIDNTSTNTSFPIFQQINDQDSEINWIEWHPKGAVFAFGTAEGGVYVYLISKQSKDLTSMSFFNHLQSSTCGNFTNNGLFLISAGDDYTCRIYDLKQRKLVMTIEGYCAEITCMSISITKNIFVIGSVCNELQFMSHDKGKILHYLSCGDDQYSIESIVFCNEEKYVAFTDSECHLKVFDMFTMQIRSMVYFEEENITKIQCSVIHSYEIYGGGSNGNFYIIDSRGKCNIKLKIQMHSDVIMDYFIDKEETFVITSSLDKRINKRPLNII